MPWPPLFSNRMAEALLSEKQDCHDPSSSDLQMSAIARSPLKLILFGEHAVLAGGRCLAVAVDMYGYLETSESPAGAVVVRDSNGSRVCLNGPGYTVPGLDIVISLDAPLGCGLGTSGAVSLL